MLTKDSALSRSNDLKHVFFFAAWSFSCGVFLSPCSEKNVFFLNKQADVTAVKSPNILKLKVGTDAFEDMEDFPGIDGVDGNIALKDPAAFKGTINTAYLTAFLNASYSEKTDFDENSPANVFRAAMGMNKVGKIETKVSMYGNRYPLEETFKLFGAYKGYGAQNPTAKPAAD